jgi:cytochrome c oxidase subunit II
MSPATVAQSILDPAGPQAASVEELWWLIFWISTAVFVIVMAVLAQAVLRSGHFQSSDTALTRSVIAGAGATVVTLFVWLIASVWAGRAIASPKMSDAVTINVTGRQWWWQLEYVDTTPANRFKSANEIHIPVGRPVVINVTSRDVIHSFWVPALHGKRDLIPGYTSALWLQADRAGLYRGQCAEFCGYQHAHMAMYVRAESDADFQKWLATQRLPAAEPATEPQQRGRTVFMAGTCPQCHSIRGTLAGAGFGPDLTHVGSRATLAAGTLPNTPQNLTRWIRNPQDIKPGSKMPPQDLSDSDLSALVEYMGQLK